MLLLVIGDVPVFSQPSGYWFLITVCGHGSCCAAVLRLWSVMRKWSCNNCAWGWENDPVFRLLSAVFVSTRSCLIFQDYYLKLFWYFTNFVAFSIYQFTGPAITAVYFDILLILLHFLSTSLQDQRLLLFMAFLYMCICVCHHFCLSFAYLNFVPDGG